MRNLLLLLLLVVVSFTMYSVSFADPCKTVDTDNPIDDCLTVPEARACPGYAWTVYKCYASCSLSKIITPGTPIQLYHCKNTTDKNDKAKFASYTCTVGEEVPCATIPFDFCRIQTRGDKLNYCDTPGIFLPKPITINSGTCSASAD